MVVASSVDGAPYGRSEARVSLALAGVSPGSRVPHLPAMHTSGRDPTRRAVLGWAIYDFANSAYTTLIVTFVYSTFFIQVVAPDGVTGTVQWSRAITVSAI